MVKERVYNDIYPPDIVPISRSTSPRFGPYFPKTFHATQKQPAKIGCSAKVLAFAWTVIRPLLSRVWGRKRAYSFRWFSLLHRSRWDSTTPFPPPPRKQSGGNYRQLFVHREAQPLGVIRRINARQAARCVNVEKSLGVWGPCNGGEI